MADPDKPVNPSPANQSTINSLSPTLSIDVSDPDADDMDVTFYDVDGAIGIDTDTGVRDGGTASVTWSGLSHGTKYRWRAKADDGTGTTSSETFTFYTTQDFDDYFTDPLRQIYLGVSGISGHSFTDIVVGAVQPDKLDYPSIHIIPDTATYLGGGEYEQRCKINYYFSKSQDYSGSSTYLDNMDTIEHTFQPIFEQLATSSNCGEYKIENIQHMTGTMGTTLLSVFEVEFRLTQLIDMQGLTSV